MNQFVVALATVAAFALAFLAPAALADHNPNHAGTSGQSGRDRTHWNSIPEEKKAAGLAKADMHRLFAKFTYNNTTGDAMGRFVSFHFAQPTGAIHFYKVMDANVTWDFFDGVTPTAFAFGEEPFVTGSVMHALSASFAFMAHNNPTAQVVWHANADLSLTFDLHANATVAGNASKNLRVNAGTLHGHILTNANATPTVAGDMVTYQLRMNDTVTFRAHPLAAVDSATLHDQNDAFTQGKLGAVTSVVDGGGGTPIEDEQEADAETETTLIQRGHVKVDAKASVAGGRVVFLTVDGETIDPARADRIVVTIGGNVAQRLAKASEVVNSTSPTFSINNSTAGAVQLVIMVHRFSTQTIDVTQAEPTTGPAPTSGPPTTTTTKAPGLELVPLVAGLVAATWAASRRRR